MSRIPILIPTLIASMALPAMAQENVGTALGQPDWNWTSEEESPFVSVAAEDALEGNTVARCVLVTDWNTVYSTRGVRRWLEATVEGPGVFQISVRTSGDPYISTWLEVDGQEDPARRFGFDPFLPNPTAWTTLSAGIRPGEHTIRLWTCFGCDNLGAQLVVNPTLEADRAELLPLDPSLGDPVEHGDANWYVDGAPTTVTGEDAFDGSDALHLDLADGSWLEAEVEGPATVSWWHKGQAVVSRIAGLPVRRHDRTPEWTRETFFVPEGTHAVRWDNDYHQAPTSHLTLDQVTTTPAADVSLTEALESGDLVFTQGGSGTWRGVATDAAPDGEDMAWMIFSNDAEEPVWLETTIEGPATLEYRVGVQGGGLIGTLLNGKRISLDSAFIFGDRSNHVRRVLPAGTHTVRWEVDSRQTPFSETALFFLDQVLVVPAEEVALEEALDQPGLIWTTGGSRPWSSVRSPFAPDEEDAVHNPNLDEGESAWLETTVQGPGRFEVRWTPLFEPQPRRWQMLINGEPRTWASDLRRPKLNTRFLDFPNGAHTIRWEIDGPVAAGLLTLDQVRWRPQHAPSFPSALDNPNHEVHWQNNNWLVDLRGGLNGGDALRFGPVGDTQRMQELSVRVIGPAEVSFFARTMGEGSALRYSAGGVPEVTIETEGSWEQRTVRIPPGLQEVELLPFVQPGGGNSVSIDQLNIRPTTIPLSTAISLSERSRQWSTSAGNPWMGVSHQHQNRIVASAGRSFPESSWLATEIEGPAVVKFQSRGRKSRWSSSQVHLDVLLDGQQRLQLRNSTFRWTILYVPTGNHTLRIETIPGTYYSNPEVKDFSVATMRGEPSLRMVGDQLELTIPRPQGYPDEQLGMAIADHPARLRHTSRATVYRSNSARLILRYDLTVLSNRPAQYYAGAHFLPEPP